MKKIDKDVVYVNLFGELKITHGDKVMDYETIRSEMVTKLFSYILINHKRIVTAQELTDVLWTEDETDNPAGALKNLVYRLRTLMKNNLNNVDYIITGRGTGTYYWNPDIPVEIDIEEFERCNTNSKMDKIPDKDKINYLTRLCEIYTGPVLSVISSEHWVIQMETFYNSLYLNAVKQMADIYYINGEFEKMEIICSDAIQHETLDEELYCLKIKSLMGQNKRKLACECYNKAVKHMQDNLGVRNPEKLTLIYSEIAGRISDNRASIDQITFENIDDEEPNKTFMCDYNIVFKEIYRLEMRRVKRLGISEYVVLFTMNTKGDFKEDTILRAMLKNAMDKMEGVIESSLRSGDVAAKCSDTQFVVLLPDCDKEAAEKVALRITNKFLEVCKYSRVSLSHDLKLLDTEKWLPNYNVAI